MTDNDQRSRVGERPAPVIPPEPAHPTAAGGLNAAEDVARFGDTLPDLSPVQQALPAAPDEVVVSWARLDDQAYDHPKVIAAGNAAFGVWCRCLSYCARHLTDGLVPGPIARHFAYDTLMEHALLSKLVDVNLLEVDGDNYRVHDYLAFNPSKTEVLSKRVKETGKKRRHRSSVSPGESTGDTGMGSSSSSPSDLPRKRGAGEKPPRWLRVPEAETLTTKRREWAEAHWSKVGWTGDVEDQWGAFKDFEYKPPGHVDVDACWRTWVRNAPGMTRHTGPKVVDFRTPFERRMDEVRKRIKAEEASRKEEKA